MTQEETAPCQLEATVEAIAEQIIASCGGDARAAVIELISLIDALRRENQSLAASSSPGYARRRPGRT
jgi:hypothetical protein